MPKGDERLKIGIWRKSTLSGANGDHCVEVTTATGDPSIVPGHEAKREILYLMRDSKNVTGPVLACPVDEWKAFIDGVKDRQFDVGTLARQRDPAC